MPWLVTDDARVLASCEIADSRTARRTGLLGRDHLEGALVLTPCRWVHTLGMRFPIDVVFDPSNSRPDERDVFDAVNDIHDYFQLFAPAFGYPNQRISAYVSRNSTCNAYWNGTINFCAAAGNYNSTGEVQQIVLHEFGHGIQDDLMGGWQGNEGLGEGNSDVMSFLLTQDSVIGRGYIVGNCTSGIRNSVNSLIYPDDVVGQSIHFAGQVIAGFNWDAMVLMQQGQVESACSQARARRSARSLASLPELTKKHTSSGSGSVDASRSA